MIWEFIQNQILGMKWLNELIGNALTMMGLDINTRVGGSIQFFIYDVLKITVLLCFLIYISKATFLRKEVRRSWEDLKVSLHTA